MIRYEVPVFMEEEWCTREAWKGILLREKRRSNVENVCFISILKAEMQELKYKIEELNTKMREIEKVICEFHNKKLKSLRDRSPFGIALCSSILIEKLSLENSLLIAPLSSGEITKKGDIFQVILSNWEEKAIEEYIKNADMGSFEILTDSDPNGPYLQPFSSRKIRTEASEVNSRTCVIIGKDKRKLILGLKRENKKRAGSGGKEIDLIITTSSFENWLMPNQRKFKGVYYTYPKLSSIADVVVREFKEEYGYKPSICALLGYDAADIAIKSVVDGGPSYEGIKDYLIQNTFELITVGKMGFSAAGVPYLIGKRGEDVFGIRYVDKDGNFKALED